MVSLKGQVAVISGAGSGIGRAIALELGAQGANLCLLGRRMAAMEEVAAAVRINGSTAQCYQVDLNEERDIRNLADCVRSAFGRLDLLVHSAGLITLGRQETAPADDLDLMYRINVRAPFLLSQVLLPMLKGSRGQIVFINSTAGLNAGPNHGLYAATKHALKALADSLRQEVNAEQVRVMSVYPGRTATPMQESVFRMEGRDYRPEFLIQPEDIAALVVSALRAPRNMEVTDIRARPQLRV